MIIDLSHDERRLILMALIHKCIKLGIMEPATPRAVRELYKNLVEKFKRDEQLHSDLEKSVGGGIIIPK